MTARMTRRLEFQTTGRLWLAVAGFSLLGLVPVTLHAQASTPNTEVIERYEQILERAPGEGPSFDKLLQIYQEGEGLEQLDKRWEPISTQTDAKGATYSLLRGLLADRMGKTDDARRLLRAATQGAPDDFHGWTVLGDFETRQGKWPDAIAAFQKGLATQVKDDDRLSLDRKLGQAQQRSLDLPAALATWQKMVEEFPKNQFALEEAGGAELEAEQYDEAKKTYQKLVDLTEPNSMNRVQALMKLAEVDDRHGKTDDAVHGYEAILPLTAQSSWLNRELRAQIEQIYRREDDLAGLVGYYQKWTKDNPKDVEALLLEAGALDELGKKPEAIEVLRQVTVLAPDRHEVRQTFAQRLVEAKQYDEAITVLTALTADDPTEPRYWETMGEALWEKTQPPTPESKKATLDAWQHIAPPESKDIAAIVQVADLCRDHTLNDEALAGYQRALALSPDASDIREKGVKLLVDLKREDEAWKLLDAMAEGPLDTAVNDLKLATLDQQFDRKEAVDAAIEKGLALEPKNYDLLSMKWNRLAEALKWSEAIALFDRLIAAAPNDYFVDQIEARHLQALTSAGMLDETEKQLRAKLGATPGMSEGELRLLLRIMVQQSDVDIPKAFQEAHLRFPQSVSINRIEIDYNRKQGNYDEAVASLQKLIENNPKQKADWLGEIVHIRQEQGRLDDALTAVQQIIDASPARTDGYLAYAEIAFAAGKTDDAVARLQSAIKLSEKPNDIRLRLARYYLDAGLAAKARTIYDDAFAAADNPQDKLSIVRAMTAAYYQDGQTDDLISRFKKEQESEEGGWRYGLYLSVIYEQMQDYGAARRELAKSLAVRPKDTALLHSLISLAEKEGDRAELLRYREALAQVDPSTTNEIALATEYANQDKSEQVWQLVQKNKDEIAKDPLEWKQIINQVTDPDFSAKIKDVIENAIRAKADPFSGRFALAQFQIQEGDLDGAKATLWQILAEPIPPPPASTAGTLPPTAASANGMPSIFRGPLMQRASQSYMALNEVRQFMMASQARNQIMQFNRMRFYNPPGVSTTLDPVSIKDHTLVYLSAIAVQQQLPADFLKDLESKIDSWHWPISEKLVAYQLIQARQPLLETIEEQAKSGQPDKDIDEFCFMVCEQFISSAITNDDDMRKRAEASETIIGDRLAQDAQFKSYVAVMRINRLAGDQTPEGKARQKVAVDEYLKTVDRKDSGQLMSAIEVCSMVGNWAEIKKAVDDLAATDRNKWSTTTMQQVGYLPANLFSQVATTKDIIPKEVIPVVVELMRLGYPTTQPSATLPAATGPAGYYGGAGGVVYFSQFGYGGQNTFPPPNRYFGPDRIANLEPLFQQLKAREMVPAMDAALEEQEKSFTDWHKNYPVLMRLFFQWWDGKHDDAIAAVRKLIEQDPTDDYRLLLASMLSRDKKNGEAIAVLDSVSARFGPDYIRAQKELLSVARLAGNNDVGQKAGLRLLSLHLPQQELMQIVDDLRNVGLKDKADAIMGQMNNARSSGMGVRSYATAMQPIQMLNDALGKQDDARAVELARQILNHDPLTPTSPYGNDASYRAQAIEALKKLGRLDEYAADIEKQLAVNPDSVRLNWATAEIYQHMDERQEKLFGLAPLPQWLKLQRTGNTVEGFYSLDGTNWVSVGSGSPDLPVKVTIGFWVLSPRLGAPLQAAFDKVAFAGKIDPPVASTTSPTPADPNAAQKLPGSWSQTDVGTVSQTGSGEIKDDGIIKITGALADKPIDHGGVHFLYQTLEGDGSLVARMTDFIHPEYDHNLDGEAGIMIRAANDPGANGVRVAFNANKGVIWQKRARNSTALDQTNESDQWVTKTTGQFECPIWLKLARKGDLFTGSISSDGKVWREVLSRKLVMGPESRVGLLSAAASSRPNQVVWSDVKVTPAQAPVDAPTSPPADSTTNPAPAASAGSLPPPWAHIDFGEYGNAGSADWAGPELKENSPVRSTGEAVRSYAYVFQSIHGDGEIVARLGSQSDEIYQGKAGLCFRSRLDDDSPEIQFFYNNAGEAGSFVHADTVDQSLLYWKKVAELSPRNQTVLLTVASQLRQAKKPASAANLYASMLKADFASSMTMARDMWTAFDEAGRLSEFVQIVDDWTPTPLNASSPLIGMGQDMYSLLFQVGNQLRQSHHLPEAERLYRKALTVDTYQPKIDGVSNLVQVLMDEKQPDAAAAEIEKWMLDKGPPPPALLPILGFNVQAQPQNWLQAMGWNSNGDMNTPVVRLLEVANELGLSPKLQQELNARADAKEAGSPAKDIDADRVSALLLAIMARDPAYRPEMEKLLKDYPTEKLNMGNTTNAFMLISQVLAKWPQERPMALRVARQVYDGLSATPNNGFLGFAAQKIIRIALASSDHKAAQEILRATATRMRTQRTINPYLIQMDQVFQLINAMVQEGMIKEAADALSDAKTDSRVVSAGAGYYQDQFERADTEIAFAAGSTSPRSFIYGLTPAEGKNGKGTEFFWALNPDKAGGGNNYDSNTSWPIDFPVRPTKWQLEIKAGPDEGHYTRLALIEKAATRGSVPVKLPPGTEVVKASIILPKPSTQASSSSSATASENSVIDGNVLLVSSPENLLQNPDFKITKDASGRAQIEGWHGLVPAGVTDETGGPLPPGGFKTLEGTNGNNNEAVSDPIPVQQGTNYFFSGWMRGQRISFRYLDAKGASVGEIGAYNNNDPNWHWRGWFFLGSNHSPANGGDRFPAKTAAVQVVIWQSEDTSFAGLSFHVWPQPKAAPENTASSTNPAAK